MPPAAALAVAALLPNPPAAEQCTMDVYPTTACTPNVYATSPAADVAACCAVCESEVQCVQWTYAQDRGNCNRASQAEARQSGKAGKTCGVRKIGPAPKPPAPLPTPTFCSDPTGFGDTCCSLNGQLSTDGTMCVCDAPWHGDNCELMGFEPVRKASRYSYGTAPRYDSGGHRTFFGNWSWGGDVVFAGGEYHMFVSVMPPGTTLANWGRSLIQHAVSKDVLGPYTYNHTTLTPGHNPAIVRLPNGTFALFSILQYGVHTSPSPYGPWTYVPQAVDCKDAPQPLCYCNNPAPWVHANGTIFLSCGGGGPNVDGIWRAENVTGPWQRLRGSGYLTFNHVRADRYLLPYGGGYEDPYLYFDARGHMHVLFHAYRSEKADVLNASCRGTLVSAHAFSEDGYVWYTSPGQPYASQIDTDTNQTLFLWSRERAKVLWDEHGKMTHLVTAVSPTPVADEPATRFFSSCVKGDQCWDCKGHDNVWDYTLVAELKSGDR